MDVEDWYHGYFSGYPDLDKSVSLMDGLDKMLAVMEEEGIHGSFFVLGELAESLAQKLRSMDAAGHEIACHGQTHTPPLSLSPDEYKKELQTAKRELEAILRHSVDGYRAPYFSLDDARLALVRDAGFGYDASYIKPQISKKYGSLSLEGFRQTSPCVYESGGFTEMETSTVRLGPMHMLLGGGYLRMLPWFFMKFMTKKYLATGQPYVMYIHPIDLSGQQIPKVKHISLNKYLRSRIGRKTLLRRIRKLICLLRENGYEFVTLAELRRLRPPQQ